METLITPRSLMELVDANVIQDAIVVAERNVFKVTVKLAGTDRMVGVRTKDGQTKERVFTSLDSVAKFMRNQVHLTRYQIDAVNFEPAASSSRKRPDAALRLKDAHAALSHTEWLLAKVEASRAGMADGSNARLDVDEWSKIRAQKLAQRTAK